MLNFSSSLQKKKKKKKDSHKKINKQDKLHSKYIFHIKINMK